VIGLVMFNLFIDRNWGLSNRRPNLADGGGYD
jgi:hypothetical protein